MPFAHQKNPLDFNRRKPVGEQKDRLDPIGYLFDPLVFMDLNKRPALSGGKLETLIHSEFSHSDGAL
jgi:hypothetical protein